MIEKTNNLIQGLEDKVLKVQRKDREMKIWEETKVIQNVYLLWIGVLGREKTEK